MACPAERSANGVHVGLKWPDDLIAGDRKVGGDALLVQPAGGEPMAVTSGWVRVDELPTLEY